MSDQPGLFDLAETPDVFLDVEDQADEFEQGACSCRFCGIATTVAGLANFEHGPNSPTCARMLARYGAPQEIA